jgi:hypothetical protein
MKLTPLFCQEPDTVGREQLIVTQGGADSLRAWCRLLQACLDIVSAVAARLERIDANHLLLGQAGHRGKPRIGPLVFHLILRPLRRKVKMLRC